MLNDEDFAELEKRYLEEKEKRQVLDRLTRDKKELEDLLNKLEDARYSPYKNIVYMKICYAISYSDSEGKYEIDMDNIDINILYDQFVSIMKAKIEKIDKEIEVEKANQC